MPITPRFGAAHRIAFHDDLTTTLDRPYEGMRVFDVTIDNHEISVEYAHGRWWACDHYGASILSETACERPWRAIVLAHRMLRRLGLY